MDTLETLCVDGIQVDEARCRELLDRSTAVATALSPYIGYAKTAEIAKESVKTGKPIREIVLERGLLEAKQLDRILSAEAMTTPGIAGLETRAMIGRTMAVGALVLVLSVVGVRRGSGPLSTRAPATSFLPKISVCSKALIAPPGRSRIRSWTRSASPTDRRSPTSARARAGSRYSLRGGSGRTGTSMRRTSSARCSKPSGGASSREGLQNVEPRLGTETDPNLSPNALDAALMVDMYQEIVERVTFLRNLARALKPNGRIGVVNYKPGQGGPGPSSNANEGVRVDSSVVEADARAAGLRVLARENLPFQYLLVLGK